jgi:hypothetical protein
MPPRKSASARNTQRQSEADSNFTFYNEGRGSVLDTEGELLSDSHPTADVEAETELPPDTSTDDAAAAQTALALIPIRFSVTDDLLELLRKKAKTVSFATAEGYEEGRKLLFTLRSFAGATERTRETLKSPFWETGKRIDATAKGITGQINEIRDPLQAAKDTEDAARAKKRQAEADAERERIRLEAEAKLAAERAELEAQRQEQARVAEEQRVAREAADAKQAEERRAFEEERRQFAEAQAKLQADREELERGSRDLALAQEATAALQVHTEPAPASAEASASWSAALVESRVSQAEIDTAIVESTLSMSPGRIDWVSPPAIANEAELIAAFARQLRSIKSPEVTSDAAAALIEQVECMLSEAAQALESFDQEAATAAE